MDGSIFPQRVFFDGRSQEKDEKLERRNLVNFWRCEKTCESTLKKVGPASRKRTFFFWHRVPNNAHVIELGPGHVHYKICEDVIAFRAFLEVPSGLSCPTRWPRFEWVLRGYPLVGPSCCWAGTHSGDTHFTCEIGTRVRTMIQFLKIKWTTPPINRQLTASSCLWLVRSRSELRLIFGIGTKIKKHNKFFLGKNWTWN